MRKLKALQEIHIPEPGPEELYTTTLLARSFSFESLKKLLGAADVSKSGDRAAGLAAEDEVHREAARSILSFLTLQHLYDHPLTDDSGRVDSVMQVNYDIDLETFKSISSMTVGELKNQLLRSPGEEIKRIGLALTGVMAAALAKLLDIHELIFLAKQITQSTKARTQVGLPGARPAKKSPFVLWMSTRPNVDQPFGKRVILGPIMNQWATASGASLSADGGTLFFHSNHRGGQGSWDLWSVQHVRKRSVPKESRHAAPRKQLSTKDLQAIIDGADVRRDEMLVGQLEKPYPPRNGTRKLEIWHSADFALAALYLNRRVDEANAVLIATLKRYPVNPNPTRRPGQPEVEDYHWHINLLLRIYFLFSEHSKYFPGRLSTEAEDALLQVFWDASRRHCRRSYADPNRTWVQWGSENHHAMSRCGFWGASQALRDSKKYRNKRYADGSTPAQMCAAWERYFMRYARERAAKGLMIEIASSYNKYTLQGWYNMTDFSTDAALRRQMKKLLDLFWADWAIEQFDAVRGGSKHRCYPGRTSTVGIFSCSRGEAWYHFAVGNPRSQHPSVMCAATSTYRPPLCVVDMVTDTAGRGEYEYISRRPGLSRLPKPKNADWQGNVLNEKFGGILRYSYCTPSFIMGTSMIEARPKEHWSNISSQNRWEGVIFSGDRDSRIFVQPQRPARGSMYNQQWSVQHKGAMIVQKLRTHKHARGQRIWFSDDLQVSEKNGWVFAKAADAYAACRVVQSGARSIDANPKVDGAPGRWLVCGNEYAPVILEVVPKKQSGSFEEFTKKFVGLRPIIERGVLQYESPFYSCDLTFYPKSTRLPRVNGSPINLRPAKVFDSPFISSKWNSGKVLLKKGSRRHMLTFSR